MDIRYHRAMAIAENRLALKSKVRKGLEARFSIPLPKRQIVVGAASDGHEKVHPFDGMSPDGSRVE